MEGIETFCGSFLQIPSWTWIMPSRKLGFKLRSIVSPMCCLLACLFVKVIDLYTMIHTLFCVCVCYSTSVRCWNRKTRIESVKILLLSHICFNWERKVSLRCDIERQQKLTQINSDLHYLWIPEQQLSWLRPQLYINTLPNAGQW